MKDAPRVLVGCERSGAVRRALRAAGVDAWSCDLEPAEDDSPHHLRGDVLIALRQPWDGGIFFPDCTYLCASGLHWNRRVPGRDTKTARALDFVRVLLDAPIPRIALENPRGRIGTAIRPADQSIQPYQFGHDASKETMLWLKNLPPLTLDPAAYIAPRLVCPTCKRLRYMSDGRPVPGAETVCRHPRAELRPRWGNQTDSGQNRLSPSERRAMDRARTYDGIAAAMAAQWGPLFGRPIMEG